MALRQSEICGPLDFRVKVVLRTAIGYINETPFMHDKWCGSFALKVLHDCGLGRDIPITDGGSGARLCESLNTTKSPLPGDVARMSTHFGIFVGTTPSGHITIDGGSFLDRVYIACRKPRPKTLFYSIERLFQ